MTGITRERASQVAASFLGGESRYLGTYYKTYAATDSQSREWNFTFDGSIVPEKKENGQKVTADAVYKTELVSPTGCAGASRDYPTVISHFRASGTSDPATCLERSSPAGVTASPPMSISYGSSTANGHRPCRPFRRSGTVDKMGALSTTTLPGTMP